MGTDCKCCVDEAVAAERQRCLALVKEVIVETGLNKTLRPLLRKIARGPKQAPVIPRRRYSYTDADADAMRRFARRVTATPAKAREFLVKAGICDARGRLTRPYRMEDAPAKAHRAVSEHPWDFV